MLFNINYWIMFRKLIIMLLCFMSVIAMHAQRMLNVADGSFSADLTKPTATRLIEPIEGGYRVKYTFDKILLRPDNLFDGCEEWYISGFTSNNIAGEPAYLYASDSFSIPVGCEASVKAVNSEWITINSLSAPARPPLFVSDTIRYTLENVPPIQDNLGWFPKKNIIDNGIQSYKGIDIINIGVVPVQFNTEEGLAMVCKAIEYEITFQENSNGRIQSYKEMKMTVSDEELLTASTLNWGWENNNQKDISVADIGIALPNKIATPEYVILSVSQYKDMVEKFAEWKRTMGFSVTTIYEGFNWTTEKIYNVLLSHENMDYLLLVGNHLQLPGDYRPMIRDNKQINVLTDTGYACIDPEGNFPTVKYGRLPVNTLAEATAALNKIIDYEKNPSNSNAFYNSNLFITNFESDSIQASKRNSQTTFEISEYIENKGRTVARLFNASYKCNPQYWFDPGYNENGIICNPAPIPNEMKKPNYNWSVSKSDIISSINQGYGQVFYFAHGKPQGWISPAFSASDVSSLTNGSNLPVFFSMACETGQFSNKGSLCEKLITFSNGGGVGVFGFTDLTRIVHTDVLSFALYNGMWPSPGMSPIINSQSDGVAIIPQAGINSVTELGSLRNLAIMKMNELFPSTTESNRYKYYHDCIFTLFGDPSMHVQTSSPISIAPSVQYDGCVVTVTAPSDYIISFSSSESNKVENFSRNVTYTLPDNNLAITLCVHKPGKAPYIKTFAKSMKVSRSPEMENEMVREGLTWKYYTERNRYMEPQNDIELNLAFYGTTTIDDKEYYNCYVWKATEEFSEVGAALIAHMREEDRKIYVRYQPDADKIAYEKGIDIIPYAPMMDITYQSFENMAKKDVLLYDFNLGIDETLYSTGQDDRGSRNFVVKGISEVECNGVVRKLWDMKGIGAVEGRTYNYYEGIGSADGLLPLPGAWDDNWYCNNEHWELVDVIDENGESIFSVAQLPGSVNTVDFGSVVIDETYHNIDGRLVNNPSKGIYIHTLHYSNGMNKTEKIIKK